MNELYLHTHFFCDELPARWPDHFAIITAYATTGDQWSDTRNRGADRQLEFELRRDYSWVHRVTGYSPSSRHAEPGWAADVDFATACDIELRYLQDAIFHVENDLLSVSYCDTRRNMVVIGSFRGRLASVR